MSDKLKNDRLTDIARMLRRDMTDAERALWQQLRAKRFAGLKFKRQVPIGPYVTDFCSFRINVVVEVDGGQHDEQRKQDEVRSNYIRQRGFKVLRFWNNEVLGNIDGVMYEIGRSIGLKENS